MPSLVGRSRRQCWDDIVPGCPATMGHRPAAGRADRAPGAAGHEAGLESREDDFGKFVGFRASRGSSTSWCLKAWEHAIVAMFWWFVLRLATIRNYAVWLRFSPRPERPRLGARNLMISTILGRPRMTSARVVPGRCPGTLRFALILHPGAIPSIMQS